MNDGQSSVSTTDGIVIVKLPERLDSTTAGAAEAAVLAELREGTSVIVDGGALIYMSAAGMRVLVDAMRQAAIRGARLVLCRFTGAAADCLTVSGFAGLLEVAGSVDEAIRKLQPTGRRPAGRLHRRGTTG